MLSAPYPMPDVPPLVKIVVPLRAKSHFVQAESALVRIPFLKLKNVNLPAEMGCPVDETVVGSAAKSFTVSALASSLTTTSSF